MLARAVCGWHHNHNGGTTPCGQSKREAETIVHYLGINHLRIVSDEDAYTVEVIRERERNPLVRLSRDGVPEFIGTDLMSQMTWEHRDPDVQEFMNELWATYKPTPEQNPFRRYASIGWHEPAHEWPHSWDLDVMAPDPEANKRIFDILREAVPPSPFIETKPMSGEQVVEMLRKAVEDQRTHRVIPLPEHMQMQFVPPSPRLWAEEHVKRHPDHIVLIAGPADTDTQCFYPSDCKATLWTDSDWDKFCRGLAGFRWEIDHNIYRTGIE